MNWKAGYNQGMLTPYKIMITIGDSGDGHGISDEYYYLSSHSANDLRLAYVKTAESIGPGTDPSRIDPRWICSDYQDHTISIELYQTILSTFPEMNEYQLDTEDLVYITQEWMAAYNIAFWRYSIPDLIMTPIDRGFTNIFGGGYGLFDG